MLRWAEKLADVLGAGAAVETFRNPGVSVWQEAASMTSESVPRAAAPAAEATAPPAAASPAAPASQPASVRSANRDDDRYKNATRKLIDVEQHLKARK